MVKWAIRHLKNYRTTSVLCVSYIAQTIHEIDHNNGSLLFHRLTNGWLPLKTIEEPSGAIVFAPKPIVKPLQLMVGRKSY